MKTLKITLLAAVFCTTLTGLSIKSDVTTTEPKQEKVTNQEDFTYAFAVKRHIKKKEGTVPSNG
ncbi:hypothetical protein [Hanstruepera ponticola]|uniref:hypothetical protein n=1 Tax=Hanstruepera ponticola TaxID=2042995 RepID=UPI000CF06C58|nr:hypothetical protein [Hanstruepera ponticola]